MKRPGVLVGADAAGTVLETKYLMNETSVRANAGLVTDSDVRTPFIRSGR